MTGRAGNGDSTVSGAEGPPRDGAAEKRLPGPTPVETLDIVSLLCERLADEAVAFCHWKSNEAIRASAAGINDLDLLVARNDAARFKSILSRLGFVQVRPRRSREVLGIEDYLGRDESTGVIVHVQPHYELIIGDDMTKVFRLPLEKAYLASSRTNGLFPLPDPAFELLVFLIRMVLKHCPLEAVLSGKGRLTASERRELAYLEARAGIADLTSLARNHLPFLDITWIRRWRAALEPDAGVVRRVIAGGAMERQLAGQARRPPVVDVFVKQWRRWQLRIGEATNRSAGKIPAPGGLVVAVVGGDGSGKTTLTSRLASLLGDQLVTHRVHLGKPRRSLMTRVVRRALRGVASPRAKETGDLLIARDRRRAYVRARRLAGRGAVVVVDRFPLDGIAGMDAPRLQRSQTGRLATWMARRERHYYDQILAPDVLLVLRVPPELAVARRGEQDAEYVRRRATEVWEKDWSDAGAIVLDASLPADTVLEHAIKAVWPFL